MKKLFYYGLLLLPTLLIWQCKDDDYPPLPPVDTSLKFHIEDPLVMSTAGGSSTITLQSAKSWTLDVEYDAADPDKNWLSVDPAMGEASGTASVTVTTKATVEERQATLVLSQSGEDAETPVRLVVKQNVDGFSVKKANYDVGYEESVVSVEFLTNVTNYAAEVAEKDQKWIVPLPATMATTEGSLSFTVKKNTGPASRKGTITLYDADGGASSVNVTVTQEGAPVTGSMIYEGNNALDAVMMNVDGEYVSWVLRKDADQIVQSEANHIQTTGWWYATPPVAGSDIAYGSAQYGGVDYNFEEGPIALRFPIPFPVTSLCFIGTNVKCSLYAWDTDYNTTIAQGAIVEQSFASGLWQYLGGNASSSGRWDPSGEYLAVIESLGEGAMVGCNTVPNASYPEWSDMMGGYEIFLDGQSTGETGTLIALSGAMGNTDKSQPFTVPGISNLKKIFSSNGSSWNMTDEYYLNKALIDEPTQKGQPLSAVYGFANSVSAVKVGTKTYMALSDADGKMWVASTTDGKDWAVEKDLDLTGSVSSMVVKDGTLNFYYAKDGALHLATASAADGWAEALTDVGQVLQLSDGANNGTVVYNDANSQFQFNYVTAEGEILSMVSASANGEFEPGDIVLEGVGDGAGKPFFVTDGEGHIGAKAGVAYSFDGGVYVQM